MSQPAIQSNAIYLKVLRPFWVWFGRAAERVFHPVEKLFYVAVVKQISWLLDHIDPLSYKIEGTLFKKILQVTIFPLFMTATVVIGFNLVKGGYTSQTFIASIGMYLIYGAIWMPLERLIPFSRKWLKNSDGSTDVMLDYSAAAIRDHRHCGAGDIASDRAIHLAIIAPALGASLFASGD